MKNWIFWAMAVWVGLSAVTQTVTTVLRLSGWDNACKAKNGVVIVSNTYLPFCVRKDAIIEIEP